MTEIPRNQGSEIQPSRPNQLTRTELQEDRIEALVKEVAELTSMVKSIVGFITNGTVIPWPNSPPSGNTNKVPSNRDRDAERTTMGQGSRGQIRIQLRSQEERDTQAMPRGQNLQRAAPDETTDPLCLSIIHGALPMATPARSVEGGTERVTGTVERSKEGGERMDTHEVTLTEVPQPLQQPTGVRPSRPQGEGSSPHNSQLREGTQTTESVSVVNTARTSGSLEVQAENRAYQGKLSKEPKVVPAKYGITVNKDLIKKDCIFETDSHYLIPKGACIIFENDEEDSENNVIENNPLLGTGTKKSTAPKCHSQERRLRSKTRAATPQPEESHGGQT